MLTVHIADPTRVPFSLCCSQLQKIDWDAMQLVDSNDLLEIGIKGEDERNKILQALSLIHI